jgi:hypothetical protein
MLLIIGLILAALGAVALLVFAWWGLPILIIGGALVALAALAGRKAPPRTMTVSPPQPTGTPRKGGGDVTTTNERVGQG